MTKDVSVYDEFNDLVNMTAKEIETWLKNVNSMSVGIKKGTTNDKKTESGGLESTGHAMGGTIVEILNKNKGELSDDDYAAMSKVTGYIKRHLKQGPSKDIENSRWRYSLMNWGHDPLK